MPLIAIARGSYSATCRLAERVSMELASKAISREEVLEHAATYGIQETGLGEGGLMEKQPPHLWDRHAPQRRQYLIILKAALMDFIIDGNAVYHGHLAQFLLTDVPKLMRIKVNASMPIRINAVMKELGLTEAAAEAHIIEIDHRRTEWSKFLYGIEYNDPQNYDIILNMDRMSLDSMAEVIVAAMTRPEFVVDKESLGILKNVHLKALVMAHLVRSPRTRGLELTVEADAGKCFARIQGMAPVMGREVWQADIRDVVSKVPGVTKIEIVI